MEGAIKAARKYAFLKDGRTDHEIIAMNHSFHGRTMGALSVTGNPHYREAFEPGIGNIRAFLKDGRTDHEIIAMNHSFHGRTMGALSVTGNPHYREAFEPGIGNIRFADMNDIESVRACVNEKTCAIILETVQGEGGIYPASEQFLKSLRALCDEKDILLIFDEIQCGMGRTGAWFAWQRYGVKPDIMTAAKALGCGVPVGAFLMTEKVGQNSLKAGDHGTTYGGNPLPVRRSPKCLIYLSKTI